ncbi:ABC transporter permease subunit [Streptomyces europaeiscabiei]|uniref:ABC transporter permease subunit n=1 Tax=Streptomyces europaeiscabiei TaxID=146819 RepID=A0ABU4NJE1_9ACTN|nr:ABC transporter permease subunit [Streptomyces europaeiscabiei]MDX2524347.1 ABC transporter permease subunit [Streptomyces europaeiscabiei]MDX2765515.1 ABC transporter permease subunit [Streptomyces europaeiscabiei]MDX2774845.1 ABC transporter permease subunit [Streptomyces europaeiscabiei]MDX3545611.1 ABC transporter permease subunit [Streptomyces europaeiscabiei]MDX3554992.1 ABC transporter permease subunit [Streptomyces europaeiscabiei]
MTATLTNVGGPPAAKTAAPQRRARRRGRIIALLFVFPALLLLGALVLYPVLFSVGRSFFDASGTRFVGGANYTEMFRDPATLKAVRNTTVWVVVAPALLTGLGLILAVLVEKIRWATAFKLLLFMPMAVSFLAAGIIFRLAYDEDPDKGVLNAAVVGIHDAFQGSSSYPTARARDGQGLTAGGDGSYRTTTSVSPGDTLALGLVGVAPKDVQGAEPAHAAAAREAGRDELRGVVYLDFTPGGGGKQGAVDRRESGLPEMKVEAVRDGKTVASTTTAADGSFRFQSLKAGSYTVTLPGSNFAPPYEGVSWLGPALVTPAIIGAYLWIWTGFAMVLIGAGLSTLPRDTLEAARMDGANEWQVFRRITVPLLAPVLTVVFVTLVINVMKVFDLVYVIAPGPVQEDATVLATQMWLVSFGGGNDQGLGSALGVLLLLLVVPAMVFNVRRFRGSQR